MLSCYSDIFYCTVPQYLQVGKNPRNPELCSQHWCKKMTDSVDILMETVCVFLLSGETINLHQPLGVQPEVVVRRKRWGPHIQWVCVQVWDLLCWYHFHAGFAWFTVYSNLYLSLKKQTKKTPCPSWGFLTDLLFFLLIDFVPFRNIFA